jgi:ATP-binding cassette subfamily B protein
MIAERDLRVRTHSGALATFYLDAFLGVLPIRSHGAGRAFLREQEGLLSEWLRAARSLVRGHLWLDATQAVLAIAGCAWMLWRVMDSDSHRAATLLLTAYWTLQLPALGQELGLILRQWPEQKNRLLRLLEPFDACEEAAEQRQSEHERVERFVSPPDIVFSGVSVRAGGHTILENIDLSLPAGGHIAIIGASGAGKSTLAAVLLGLHAPATGTVTVDGRVLGAAELRKLRRSTVWVDPQVHLWNRSLLDNIVYGVDRLPSEMSELVHAANLDAVLIHLSHGFATTIGEGGRLLSGGEGQRVRLARGMARARPALVILDEPFRGLARSQRRALLARARQRWQDATLLYITHDVGETQGFSRVLVLKAGRLVENGAPQDLASDSTSEYRRLLDAERDLENLWNDRERLRTLKLRDGVIATGAESS